MLLVELKKDWKNGVTTTAEGGTIMKSVIDKQIDLTGRASK